MTSLFAGQGPSRAGIADHTSSEGRPVVPGLDQRAALEVLPPDQATSHQPAARDMQSSVDGLISQLKHCTTVKRGVADHKNPQTSKVCGNQTLSKTHTWWGMGRHESWCWGCACL